MVIFVLQVIAVLSVSSLVLMVFRKIPALASLSTEETQRVSDKKGAVLKKLKVVKKHFDSKTADGLKVIKEQSEKLKQADGAKQEQFNKQPDYWDQITKD